MKRNVLLFLIVLVTAATWFWAGWRVGTVQGRDWRGALVDAGCAIVCKEAL